MEHESLSYKSIKDISIFGEYKNPEDRLTAALLQVLHYGGHELVAYIFSGIIDLPNNEINVIPQSSQHDSRPDGEISCDCHYRLFIESKIVPNAIRVEQLNNHCKLANPSNGQYLIYLTPDSAKPQKLQLLNGLVEWMSWDQISEVLLNYLEMAGNELLKFLIKQLILLIANTLKKSFNKKSNNAIIDQKDQHERVQTPPNDNVIIVGGHWGENIALKYNFYACQVNRYFADAQYIAFYHQHRIKELFKIVEKPIDSTDIQKCPKIDKRYFTNEEPNYTPQQRKLFLLQHVYTFSPVIKNDKVDKNGDACAFVQRQTYTTYSKIMKAKCTSEL